MAHLRQAVCIASGSGDSRFVWLSTDGVKNPEKEQKLEGISKVEQASLRCKPHTKIIYTVQMQVSCWYPAQNERHEY